MPNKHRRKNGAGKSLLDAKTSRWKFDEEQGIFMSIIINFKGKTVSWQWRILADSNLNKYLMLSPILELSSGGS